MNFHALIQLFYPDRCGVCGSLGDEPICAICQADFRPGDGAVRTPAWRGGLDGVAHLYHYEGRARQAVQRLKFDRATLLARPMADAIASFVTRSGLDSADFFLPVPIHWVRRAYRGFNQSELLCERLDPRRVRTDLLRRVRATRPQVGLAPDERRRNLLGAFLAKPGVSGASVVLVDDVITTGHTVGECARALKEAGALEVRAVAFCGSE
jgi:competence protein ComFC